MEADPVGLAPIEHRTLADMVAERIRDAIFKGQLKPGQRLTEPMLASSFDVSRSPVREALSRLKNQGLVVGSASSYVWGPTPVDVDEIFSLRTALECLAAEWALRKNGLTEKDFAHLQSLVDGLERMIESATSLPVSALLKADERFYGYICRHSRHSLLTRLWQQTVYRQHVLMSYLLRSGDLVEAAQVILSDHQSILSALRGGDLTEVKERHRIVNESRAHRTKKMLMESAHS